MYDTEVHWRSTHTGPRKWLLALSVLLLVGPGRADAQERPATDTPAVIIGRVVDVETGEAVVGAEIALDGTSFRAVTNGRGEFRIDPVDAGTHVLLTRRLGYEERSDSLQIPSNALMELTVELSTRPVELAGLVVTVGSAVLYRQGFYARQTQGYGGVFIDRQMIEEKRPSTTSDLFRNIPGLRVVWGGIHGARIFINQRITFSDGELPGCEPSVWLDGIRSTMRTFDMMRAEEIEGIEVYARGGAPGKFVDPCGTVAIWTRQRING